MALAWQTPLFQACSQKDLEFQACSQKHLEFVTHPVAWLGRPTPADRLSSPALKKS